MNLPTPTTTAEIYLAAIHKQQGEILEELRSQRPLDLSKMAAQAVELKEPKRKAK